MVRLSQYVHQRCGSQLTRFRSVLTTCSIRKDTRATMGDILGFVLQEGSGGKLERLTNAICEKRKKALSTKDTNGGLDLLLNSEGANLCQGDPHGGDSYSG